jgi:hypothetical protein
MTDFGSSINLLKAHNNTLKDDVVRQEAENRILTEALQNLASDYRRTQMGRYMNTQDWVDQYIEMAKRIVESNDVDIS